MLLVFLPISLPFCAIKHSSESVVSCVLCIQEHFLEKYFSLFCPGYHFKIKALLGTTRLAYTDQCLQESVAQVIKCFIILMESFQISLKHI